MKVHDGHQFKLNMTSFRLWILIVTSWTRGFGISTHIPINNIHHVLQVEVLHNQLIPTTLDQQHQNLFSITYHFQKPFCQQIGSPQIRFSTKDFVQSIDEFADTQQYTSSAAKATVTRILPIILIIATIYYFLLDETVEEDEDGIIMKKNTSDVLLLNATSDNLLDGTIIMKNTTDNLPVNVSLDDIQQIQTQPPTPIFSQDKDFQPMVPYDGIYVPHLPFGDENLNYRRVCAPVGAASLLCMTLKYPFSFDVQDPTRSYPFPVDDRFYEINNRVTFIDGTDLNECLSKKQNAKQCLDGFDPPYNNTIVGIWTRNPGSEPDENKLYGVSLQS